MRMCRLLVMVVIAAILAAAGGPSRADEEPAILARYKTDRDGAVDKGLAYLAARQAPDGKPLAGSFMTSDNPAGQGNPGITSLGVMAFLSKGHTPGTGPYGEVINRGIDFVISTLNPATNTFGTSMYVHCISTLMISEVSGMVDPERQRKIDLVLPRAMGVIVRAQRVPKPAAHAGGWRYSPNSTDSDLSLTGWAVMALRSGRLNGAAIAKESVDRATEFILRCRMPDGGFCYQPGGVDGSGMVRTGIAVLCLELSGQHGHPAAIAGGEFILRKQGIPNDVTTVGGRFYYGMYYCSQAMFQLGGKYWESWAPWMYNTLIKRQRSDGSWPVEAGYEYTGTVYSTSMAVLAMTVSCRQLPIYQR